MNNNPTDIIQKYFPDITPEMQAQFGRMGELYPEWNAKINVISRRDIDNLYVNHILHSLSIARFVTPTDGSQIIDLGTGGGFPGIPLAVMFPEVNFHLVDRIAKKLKVAQSVADELGLKNVTIQHGDMSECKLKADFVVSRAVMRLDELVKASRRNIATRSINKIHNGLICLKGGDIAAEATDQSGKASIPFVEFDLSMVFDEPFFETKKIVYAAL